MSSEIGICNHSLALLGVRSITSFDDGTTESSLCATLYPTTRDEVLEVRAWTFATDRATLLPDATDPDWGYDHRFLIPTTTRRVLAVWENPPQPGQENVTIPLNWNREGRYILASLEKIYVRFTHAITDTTLFSDLFADVLAYRLAADMCIALTQSRTLMVDMNTLYTSKLVRAGLTDGQQGVRENKYVGSYVLRR